MGSCAPLVCACVCVDGVVRCGDGCSCRSGGMGTGGREGGASQRGPNPPRGGFGVSAVRGGGWGDAAASASAFGGWARG